MKQQDQRFIRSEQNINDAFVELMGKEGFNKLTTTQIIQEAGINRATFYAHYQDKYDLLDQFEKRQLATLTRLASQVSAQEIDSAVGNRTVLRKYLAVSVRYFHKHGAVYELLMSAKGDPSFTKQLAGAIKEVWQLRQMTAAMTIPTDYAVTAITSLAASLIEKWVQDGFELSEQEFTEIVMQLIGGMPAVLAKQPEEEQDGDQ